MGEFFLLDQVFSQQLVGEVVKSDAVDEGVQCPANPEHQPWSDRALASRVNPHLEVEVRHNKRDHMMIWTRATRDCLVHTGLLTKMRSAGFTGYSVRPAIVRFRDGFVSYEYQRLGITGWGGLARTESGIQLVEQCSGCAKNRWSALIDPSRLIDRNQWNGEDFFIVWPLANYIFVSKRAADFLVSWKVRNCAIRDLSSTCGDELFGGNDFRAGSLAGVLPSELALKFGKPLGLA